MAKKKTPIKYISLLVMTITILLALIYMILPGNGTGKSNFDLIEQFEKAEKAGFPEADFIPSNLPAVIYRVNHSRFQKSLINIFSDKKTYSTPPRDSSFPITMRINNGALRLKLINPRKDSNKYRIDISDSLKKTTITFVAHPGKNGRLEIRKKSENGKTVTDSLEFRMPKGADSIYIVRSSDYLIILNKREVLYQRKDKQFANLSEWVFSVKGESRNFILKYAEFNRKIMEKIKAVLPAEHENIREHTVRLDDRDWNYLYGEHQLRHGKDATPFLRRLKLGSYTMPSIYLPLNSSVEYRLSTPPSAVLDAFITVMPDFVKDASRIIFEVSIRDNRTADAKIFKFKLSDYKDWKYNFNPVRLNLEKYISGEFTLRVRFTTVDGKLLHNESRIIGILSSPVVRAPRQVDEFNIILICLDTLRADRLGCYGYTRNTSPRIDRFAQEGLIFENAISHSSWTLPSHMSLFTSLYPLETGFVVADDQINATRMAENIVPLAKHLKDTDYKTVAFTGGSLVSALFGFDRGFDSYFETRNSSRKDVKREVDRALEWIKKNRESRFFMFFHTYEIHSPYKHSFFVDGLKEKSIRNIAEAKYDSGIKYTDEHIGRLLDNLKKLGLYDKTLIIITSDHGENFDYTWKSGAGVHGITVYDREIRVPLIMGGLRKLPRARLIRNQVRLIDVMPTILDLLDIEIDEPMRGASLLNMIKGKDSRPRIAFSENLYWRHSEKKSIRIDDYKMIVKYGHKLKDPGKVVGRKLYSLKDDLEEKHDIAKKQPEKVERYYQLMMKIMDGIRENLIRLKKMKTPGLSNTNDLKEQLEALGYLGN